MKNSSDISVVDRVGAMPLYRQVERHIEELIERDNLGPRDPIPSATALARELGINHLTVRRAIGELTQRNIVVARQGRGTFVADAPARKVLWVCGLNIFSGDISPYYTDMLRFSSEALEAQGIGVEAVWLPREHSDEARRYAAENVARSYVGFIFCSVRDAHPLMDYAISAGRPAVKTGFAPVPRMCCVSYDLQGADRLALAHLASQGHRHVSLMGLSAATSPWLQGLGHELGLTLDYHGPYTIADGQGRQSTVEHRAFDDVMAVLKGGSLASAVYISDEIVARGATRAMLSHEGRQPQRDIVVRCAEQKVIPLGLPVTFVVFDAREQAQQAVRMLTAQIGSDNQRQPEYYECKYQIVGSPDEREARSVSPCSGATALAAN